MRRELVGMAIDILKWLNEPLFRVHKMVRRLQNRRIDLLVNLQFKYHELRKQSRVMSGG